jgi:hypothetical protein
MGASSKEMGGSVGSAPLATAALRGLNPDISLKYKMGDISKGVANTLYLIKKYTI